MGKKMDQPSSGGVALARVEEPNARGAAGFGSVVEVVFSQRGNVVGRYHAVPRSGFKRC